MSHINESNKDLNKMENWAEQRTPDISLSIETKNKFNKIVDACKASGLDGFDYIYEFFHWDEISELAAYGGFPVRFPHYLFGMEFEHIQQSYQYGYSKIYEMVINNCIDGNARVATKKGLIKLSDIQEGSIYFDNSDYQCSSTFDKGMKKTLKLVFDDGREIKVTPDHEIVRYDGTDIAAQHLSVGDYVRISRKPIKFECSLDFSEYKLWTKQKGKGGHNYKNITIPSPDSKELAELIGILLGDGTYNNDKVIEIAVGLEEKEYKNYICKLISNLFNLECVVDSYTNGFKIHVCCKQLRQFLIDQIGLNKEKCPNKKIPESVYRMSSEQQAAFIRGLFDTNGHFERSIISFSNKSKDIIIGMQILLQYMGIRSRILKIDNEYNNIFLLNIVDQESRQKFISLVGSSNKKKSNILKETIIEKKYSSGWSSVPNMIFESIKQKLIKKSKKGHSYIRSQKQFNLINQINKALLDSKNKNVDLSEEMNLLENYWFSKIVSIEDGGEINVFDIEVDKVNHFEASGIQVHNSPCYAYLLNSNNEIDNLTVIAHAYAHNDFFKNNLWFSKSNRNMMNEMAGHGTKIRRYGRKYGRDKVSNFLDLALSIQFLVDPNDVFEERKHEDILFEDEVNNEEPRKIKVQKDHEYMDDFINPKSFIKEERDRIKKDFEKKMVKFPENPTRDVIGFLANYSPRLRNWMRDILFMLREEALYFLPQAQTKIINEGWASFWDEQIMAKQGYAGDEGIIEYAHHHAGVMGHKYSRNPYATGNMLLKWIKDRWDKGKFGDEWENCKDAKKRKEWDKKLGLGMEKIFEVRKMYNDYMLIDEFMDQDFCDEHEYYLWEKNKKGEHILISRDADVIKKRALQDIGMQRMPIIEIKDVNALNLGHLHLQHKWTNKTLSFKYADYMLRFISRLWGRPIVLSTYSTHDSYDPSIPMEYNDKITPVTIFYNPGDEKSYAGTWQEYSYFFSGIPMEKIQ